MNNSVGIITQLGRVYCHQSQSVRNQRRGGDTNWLWDTGRVLQTTMKNYWRSKNIRTKALWMQAQCFLSEWKVIWIAREVRYMLLLSVNQLLCKTEKHIRAILKAWGKKLLDNFKWAFAGERKRFFIENQLL